MRPGRNPRRRAPDRTIMAPIPCAAGRRYAAVAKVGSGNTLASSARSASSRQRAMSTASSAASGFHSAFSRAARGGVRSTASSETTFGANTATMANLAAPEEDVQPKPPPSRKEQEDGFDDECGRGRHGGTEPAETRDEERAQQQVQNESESVGQGTDPLFSNHHEQPLDWADRGACEQADLKTESKRITRVVPRS